MAMRQTLTVTDTKGEEWELQASKRVDHGEEHTIDHRALWEALIYLNRRVKYLETCLESEGD